MASSESIEIESNEGRKFTLSPTVAAECKLLPKASSDGEAIKLSKFNTTICSKVILFCTYHATKEQMTKLKMPLKSFEMKDNVQKWFADFIDGCDQATLYQLITAGNDLGIAPLMSLASAKVACEMRKMPREQMIQLLGAAAQAQGMLPTKP